MASENEENAALTANRPEDSDFKQQRLKAWQPILTPAWVIGTFLSVGIVFIAIGIAVLIASNDVVEQSTAEYQGVGDAMTGLSYPGTGNAQFGNQGQCPNKEGFSASDTTAASCITPISMTLKEDMDAPVYMYFELSNFYQNHRRYVKSRNDQQLMDRNNYDKTEQCSPINSVSTPGGCDVDVYPCGLIAWSAINDTVFAMDMVGGEPYFYTDHILVADEGYGGACTSSTCKLVPSTSNGIAWGSDRNEKFQSLDNCPGNSALLAQQNPIMAMPYPTYKYYMCGTANAGVPASGQGMPCAIGQTTATAAATGGSTQDCVNSNPPNSGTFAYGTTAGDTTSTCEEQYRCGDVTNEEFIVWMRTSGLPTFRKLHRVINTDLKKGQTVLLYVNDVFPVTAFDGTKKIVLSTTTWIGGKNTFLGAAYISVACICILLGVGFLIKELLSPKSSTDVLHQSMAYGS